MLKETDQYYFSKDEPNRSCLLALRNFILSKHSGVMETKKYGMPCFCCGTKIICYLWIDKKTEEPYILFVQGSLLEHPLLEQGKRAKMKILRINPNTDLPIQTLNSIFELALSI